VSSALVASFGHHCSFGVSRGERDEGGSDTGHGLQVDRPLNGEISNEETNSKSFYFFQCSMFGRLVIRWAWISR
jgi:hypothetical protein